VFCMPKGASAPTAVSTNAFGPRLKGPKAPSKTSTRFCEVLAAKSRGTAGFPMARPVYTAPGVVATVRADVFGFRLPLQASMVPFRLAKMKLEVTPFTGKAVVLLLTCPVGPWGPDAVVGIATLRAVLVTTPVVGFTL